MAKINQVRRQFVGNDASFNQIQQVQEPFRIATGALEFIKKQRQELDNINARTEVAKADSEATLAYNAAFNNAKTTFANDPKKGEQEFSKVMAQEKSRISRSLTSEAAKSMFARTSSQLEASYGVKYQNWTTGQLKKNSIANIETTANSYKDQAYIAGKAGDLESFQQIQANIGDLVVGSAGVVGSASDVKKLSDTIVKDNTTSFITGMVRDNPEQALSILQTEDFNGIYSTQEIDKFKDTAQTVIKQNQQLDAKKKKDTPFVWLAEAGFETPSIELNNPESFRDREAFVLAQRELNPDMDIPPLTKNELDGVTNAIRNMNPDELTGFMLNINTVVSDNMIDDIAQQVFSKNPVQGMALSVAGQAPEIASRMIRGEAFIAEKAIKLPNDSEFLTQANDFMGNAIADPALIRQIVDSSKALYAANAFDLTDVDSSIMDADLYKNAIREVVGDIATIGNAKTFTFRDANNNVVTADDFQDRFDDLEDADFFATDQFFPQVGGEAVTSDFIKEWGKLVPIGDGIYNIHLRTTNQYMTDANGDPYVFNFKDIYNQ